MKHLYTDESATKSINVSERYASFAEKVQLHLYTLHTTPMKWCIYYMPKTGESGALQISAQVKNV